MVVFLGREKHHTDFKKYSSKKYVFKANVKSNMYLNLLILDYLKHSCEPLLIFN